LDVCVNWDVASMRQKLHLESGLQQCGSFVIVLG
jgi:hypothetical protein